MVVKGPKRRAGVIGVNLRKLRDAAGLSQRALAGKAGVHYVTIANLETGATQSADHDTITKLALALGVREGDLVEALQAAPIEPLLREYLVSPWAAITKPTEDELQWLREQSVVFWRGVEPTVESIDLFIRGRRQGRRRTPQEGA